MIDTQIEECFTALAASSPKVWSAGGTRNCDILLNFTLPIPDVDGGGVDVWESIKALTLVELNQYLETGLLDEGDEVTGLFVGNIDQAPLSLNLVSAFVNVEKDAGQDVYRYRFTVSAFAEF